MTSHHSLGTLWPSQSRAGVIALRGHWQEWESPRGGALWGVSRRQILKQSIGRKGLG